jgi:hypothetical protein
MATEPTLAEIIREAITSRLLDVHVCLPGRVESYNEATQTADVLPMIRRPLVTEDGEVVHEDLPKLPNVPVVFQRTAAFSMSFPLVPGDFVLLMFSSSAVGNWRTTGDVSDPGDLRRHDLSGAFAVPGIAPEGSVIPTSSTAVVVEVTAPVTHVAVGAAATDFVGLASLIETTIGNLAAAILNATPVPNDGGAAIQTAAKITLSALGWSLGVSPPVNATAASKLKSE